MTLRKPKGVLTAFSKFTDEPDVHTVTEESIIAYLESLRANDGINSAKKKTWNNHRNELASFFKWAGMKHLSTNRPWTFNNPAQGVLRHSNERIAEERPAIEVTSTETAKELLSYVMTYKKGKLAKFYALELKRTAKLFTHLFLDLERIVFQILKKDLLFSQGSKKWSTLSINSIKTIHVA